MVCRRNTAAALSVAGLLALAACGDQPTQPAPTTAGPSLNVATTQTEEAASAYLAQLNDQLASQDLQIEAERAEWLYADEAPTEAGNIVFANDRQLRLSSQFVPFDTRRGADGDNISYIFFGPARLARGVSGSIDAVPAVTASFETWKDVKCSKLNLVDRGITSTLPSVVLRGGVPFQADISTVGFLPGSLFDAVLGPGAATRVLGVTFTFVFGTRVNGVFTPSDIDGDGRNDTALKEIWYNNNFTWSTDGRTQRRVFDIETVALHENGHALELGHFGKIFRTVANGKLHFSPLAVMNASYSRAQREPRGTDNGAYCGNWASWPN